MTSRERILLYIVGGLVVGGLGFVAYSSFIKPIRDKNAEIANLKEQIENKEVQLFRDAARIRELRPMFDLSLPLNRELAEGEYQTLLTRLLDECDIKGGKPQLQTQSETEPEPDLMPTATPGGGGVGVAANKNARKAYSKVNYLLTMEKVTLLKLTDFLVRYHQVPLMHQIVKCTIKHSPAAASNAAMLKARENDRNDLTVTLVTEAIIVDGAPDRKTLLPVPDVFGAAVGVWGLNNLRNDKVAARDLLPKADLKYYLLPKPKASKLEVAQSLAGSVLADATRQYDLIAARDPFHGPLPEYPPYKKPDSKKEEKKQETPPPYDSSPFVKLHSLLVTSEGTKTTANADVRDIYYDQYYTLDFTQFGDLFESKILRLTRDTREKTDPRTGKKTGEIEVKFQRDPDHPKSGSIIEISDRSGKAIRTFKIHGLNGDSLILGEKEKAPAKDDKAVRPGVRPVKGAKPAPVPLPTPDPKMAAVGGMLAMKPPTERIFLWQVGHSLAEAREVKKPQDIAALMAKAGKGLKELKPVKVELSEIEPKTNLTTTPTQDESSELAPLPRKPLN